MEGIGTHGGNNAMTRMNSPYPSNARAGAARRRFAAVVALFLGLAVAAPAQDYTNASSVVDGAGRWSGGGTYSNIGAAAQPGGISVSTNAGYVHYAGFLNTFALRPTLDTDHDGLVNEFDPDNDNDRLLDASEITGDAFGYLVVTDPNNADSDDDQFADGDEQGAGTNPKDNSQLLAITSIRRSGGNVSISWMARSNRLYRVLGDTALADGSVFTNVVADNVLATGPAEGPWYSMTNTYSDSSGSATNAKFYVIEALP